jgi:hypothetical protein
MAIPNKETAAPARARGRVDDANAFFPDPSGGPAHAPDELAEELAEEFVSSATSGEEAGEDGLEQVVPEENGGPFIQTSGDAEFADGTDESNPADAEVEPFPTPTGSPGATQRARR